MKIACRREMTANFIKNRILEPKDERWKIFKLFENRCLKSYLQEKMSEIIFLSQKIDGMGGERKGW